MNSILGPLAAFAAVLVLIPVALWLLKRTPLGAAAGATAGLRVVASLAIAPNQRLLTVEVGQGDDRRWLVLGVTPGGIRTLHTMPPQAQAPQSAALPSFAQLIARKPTADGSPDAR